MTIVLEFNAPAAPLSINQGNTMHWAKRRRILEPWGDLAWVHARNYRTRNGYTPVPVEIQPAYQFRNARRRDAHNYTGTVTKAIVDGLVRAGLVPDDTPEWVTVLDPILTLNRDKTVPLRCTLTIRPRPTEESPHA